jgi:hypothetical protein
VPDEYRLQLKELMGRYLNMIASETKLPAVNNAALEINLIDNYIVNRRPYRLSISERG